MSEVNAGDLRIINSVEDVIDTYTGAGERGSMAGIEIELAYFDPQSPDLTPMSLCQNKVVKNAANAALGGDAVRNEPTAETLEVSSFARGKDDLKSVMDDANIKIRTLSEKAADVGLKRSYFQHMPYLRADQLLENLIDIPRYQSFFGPPRGDMLGVAAYFSVCKSNQVSLSYFNADHMAENVRRLYVLAPFLFTITDNAPPFNEGLGFKDHAGMHHRAALGARGGIPPYIFKAKTGQDYVLSHIDQVMTNPLFVYYNEMGELVRLPEGQWITFNDLRERGLNTATNYYFSESILWPDVKIAALKDDEERVVNHRYEARMLGVGLHQHQSALLIVAALAYDENFASLTNFLLKEAGFDLSDPASLRKPLEKAYHNALHHNGRFMDIGYGSMNMNDFARKFADLMENSFILQGLEEEAAPILEICRNGWTDSKVNAHLFPTLEQVKNFMRHHDPSLFEDPNTNAYRLFHKDLGLETTRHGEADRI